MNQVSDAIAAALAADLQPQDYGVVGLATCFLRQEGELEAVDIIEPVPSAALEAILKGIPTSYKMVRSATVADLWSEGRPVRPADFPETASFCEDFGERLVAAVRTYRDRAGTVKESVPLGTTRTDFNYSTERKRLLNSDRLVKAEDNVKQHAYTHQVL